MNLSIVENFLLLTYSKVLGLNNWEDRVALNRDGGT